MKQVSARFMCPICCEEKDYIGTFDCGHTVCATCALIHRALQRHTTCIECKTEAKLLVTSYDVPVVNFRQFEHRNKSQIKYDAQMKSLIHQSAQIFVERLNNPPCPVCGTVYPSFDELKHHLEKEHHKVYCYTCLKNKPKFRIDQTTYDSPREISEHMKTHARCKLCNQLHYDAQALNLHYQQVHSRCELCTKFNVKDSYWADENALIEHYREAHFVCPFQGCQANMIAFVSKKEQIEHLLSEHNDELSDNQRKEYAKELMSL